MPLILFLTWLVSDYFQPRQGEDSPPNPIPIVIAPDTEELVKDTTDQPSNGIELAQQTTVLDEGKNGSKSFTPPPNNNQHSPLNIEQLGSTPEVRKAPSRIVYPQSNEVLEVQRLLNSNGYYAGLEDGKLGPTTKNAIEKFQKDSGLSVDGSISPFLISMLSQEKAPQMAEKYRIYDLNMTDIVRSMGMPDSFAIDEKHENDTWFYGSSWVSFNMKHQHVNQVHQAGELSFIDQNEVEIFVDKIDRVRSRDYKSNLGVFTQNNHKSAILAIHGKPDSILVDKYLSLEYWFFGKSTVEVSIENGQILRFNNAGNLKIKMIPGDHITNRKYFKIGSHLDDVIRLQGTPIQIKANFKTGHDTWIYPEGDVLISPRKQVVVFFWDEGGLLARK